MANGFIDVPYQAPPSLGNNQSVLSNVAQLQVGFGSQVMRVDRQGQWLGAQKFVDAPFSVTPQGDVVANSINLGGAYIATGGAASDINSHGTELSGTKIVNLSITGTKIADDSISTPKLQANSVVADKIATNAIVAGKIDAGAIVAGKIAAGAINATNLFVDGIITAAKMNVSSLSAISANLGAVTVGGSADVLGTISVRSSSNTEIAKLNSSGIIIRNTRGLFFEQTTAGNYWDLSVNSSNQAVMSLPTTNQFFIKNFAGSTNLFTVSSSLTFSENPLSVNGALVCKELFLNYGQNEGNIRNVDQVRGYNDLRLYESGQDDAIFFYSGAGGGDLSMYPYYGDFYASGTKHFRIPHPDHPEDGWLQYVSVESPEVALKIRGVAKLINGKVKVVLPHHWDLVTEEFLTTVTLTPLDNCKGLYSPKSSLSNKSFEVVEMMNGKSETEFSWELTATRKGYSDFNPEQTIEDEANKSVKMFLQDQRLSSSVEHEKKNGRRMKLKNLIKEKMKNMGNEQLRK